MWGEFYPPSLVLKAGHLVSCSCVCGMSQFYGLVRWGFFLACVLYTCFPCTYASICTVHTESNRATCIQLPTQFCYVCHSRKMDLTTVSETQSFMDTDIYIVSIPLFLFPVFFSISIPYTCTCKSLPFSCGFTIYVHYSLFSPG